MREFSMERFEVQQPISQLFKLCNKGLIFGVRLFQTIDKSPQIFQKKNTDFYDKYHHFITLYIYSWSLCSFPVRYCGYSSCATLRCPSLPWVVYYSTVLFTLPSAAFRCPTVTKVPQGSGEFSFCTQEGGEGVGQSFETVILWLSPAAWER